MILAGKQVGDEDLEEMIESGNPGVFTQGIITDTQQAKQTLADIEARHNDIMKLESSIRELHDMFMDMAMLVESQVRDNFIHSELKTKVKIFREKWLIELNIMLNMQKNLLIELLQIRKKPCNIKAKQEEWVFLNFLKLHCCFICKFINTHHVNCSSINFVYCSKIWQHYYYF